MREAEVLAAARLASMVAPAGCGKTQVIAEAVARHERSTALILTHTHAGVDVLRERLRRLGAPASRYYLTTIAGWALRLATHYPRTSGVTTDTPTGPQWDDTCLGAARALRLRAVREAVTASYGGVYIDEYQDCTDVQHQLVVALSDVLPCRVIGDPLQGIFGFGGRKCVAWSVDVPPRFPDVAGPTMPHRWASSNPALGTWLQTVREDLLAGRAVNLVGAPVHWIRPPMPKFEHQARVAACRGLAKTSGAETVVAIFGVPWDRLGVARSLGGQFSCIEPIESDDLFTFAARMTSCHGPPRAAAVLDFAIKCMVGVSTPMTSVRTALSKGRALTKIRNNLPQRDALADIAVDDNIDKVARALEQLQLLEGVHTHRRELLAEARKALVLTSTGKYPTLLGAARAVRNQTRIVGRRVPRRAIGTTLLVKGLEFEHAVVLRPESMDARNLYVALTRGTKSLTIVSASSSITPSSASESAE